MRWLWLPLLLLLLTPLALLGKPRPAFSTEPYLAMSNWLPAGVQTVRVSPDGLRVITAPGLTDRRRPLELWDVASGRRLALLHPPAEHMSVQFLPPGNRVVALTDKEEAGVMVSRAWVWDSQNGKLLKHSTRLGGDLANQPALISANTVVSWNRTTEVVELSGSERSFRSASQLLAWYWPTDKVRIIAEVQGAHIEQAEVSPDGSMVAATTGANMVGVWEARTGKLINKRFGLWGIFFTSDPRIIGLSDGIYQLPGLLKKAPLPPDLYLAQSGRVTYALTYSDKNFCLNPSTLERQCEARVVRGEGFDWGSAVDAGALPEGRILFWDSLHRATAVLEPG